MIEKLKLSKTDVKKVSNFYKEDGLIDDCKYMLEFKDGYSWDGYTSVPCRNIKEAKDFIRDAKL